MSADSKIISLYNDAAASSAISKVRHSLGHSLERALLLLISRPLFAQRGGGAVSLLCYAMLVHENRAHNR